MSLCENTIFLCSGCYSLIVFKMLFKRQLGKKERGHFLSCVCRSAAVTDNENPSDAFVLFCALLC